MSEEDIKAILTDFWLLSCECKTEQQRKDVMEGHIEEIQDLQKEKIAELEQELKKENRAHNATVTLLGKSDERVEELFKRLTEDAFQRDDEHREWEKQVEELEAQLEQRKKVLTNFTSLYGEQEIMVECGTGDMGEMRIWDVIGVLEKEYLPQGRKEGIEQEEYTHTQEECWHPPQWIKDGVCGICGHKEKGIESMQPEDSIKCTCERDNGVIYSTRNGICQVCFNPREIKKDSIRSD